MKTLPAHPCWIWSHDNAADWTRRWSCFRKSFFVPAPVPKAHLLFAGTGCHEVFVNGVWIGSGDKLGCITRYDITPHLRPGRNVVAARALGSVRFRFQPSAIDSCGIIGEIVLVARGRRRCLGTDATWRTRVEPPGRAWQDAAFNSRSWQPAVVLSRLGDDPTDEPKGWCLKAWRRPAPDKVKPIRVQARDLPAPVLDILGPDYRRNIEDKLPERVFAKTVRAVRAHGGGISGARNLLHDNPAVCLIRKGPGKNAPVIVLDFGRTVVGHLEIEFDGQPRCGLRLQTELNENPLFEFLGGLLSPHLRQSLTDLVTVAPGRTTWRNPQRRGFRYLAVYFDGPGAVAIRRLFLNLAVRPLPYLGYFKSSDQLLNRIWQTGRYTVQVCSNTNQFDSEPRLERGFFTGDGRVDALIASYCFGETALIRRCLDIWAATRHYALDGKTSLVSRESDCHSGLWDYLCWYIISIHDYYWYSGDPVYVRRHYRRMGNVLEWLAARLDPHGLVYQVMLDELIQDWSCSRRLGEKTFLNALFYRSLLCVAEFADLFRDAARARRYRRMARRLRACINQRLWNDRKQCYFERRGVLPPPPYSSHDSNALTVWAGVADTARARQALDYLRREHWVAKGPLMLERQYIIDHPEQKKRACVAPFITFHEVLARYQEGDHGGALQLIRKCWGNGMLKDDATTCFEYIRAFQRSLSRCHAWGAGATYLLQACVLGVRPTQPGFKTCLIAPRLGNLSRVKGAVPTPHGIIAVACTRRRSGYSQEIFIPAGVRATVGIPRDAIAGRRIEVSAARPDAAQAVARPRRAGRDRDFIYFTAPAGVWSFTASS